MYSVKRKEFILVKEFCIVFSVKRANFVLKQSRKIAEYYHDQVHSINENKSEITKRGHIHKTLTSFVR